MDECKPLGGGPNQPAAEARAMTPSFSIVDDNGCLLTASSVGPHTPPLFSSTLALSVGYVGWSQTFSDKNCFG